MTSRLVRAGIGLGLGLGLAALLSACTGDGGVPAVGTVTLSAPAPAGGTEVTLASAIPSVATVPAAVTVSAGATSATFAVTTVVPKTSTPVTISAIAAGVTLRATVRVLGR